MSEKEEGIIVGIAVEIRGSSRAAINNAMKEVGAKALTALQMDCLGSPECGCWSSKVLEGSVVPMFVLSDTNEGGSDAVD